MIVPVSTHTDLLSLRFDPTSASLTPQFLKGVLDQKSPLVPVSFALIAVAVLIAFGFYFEGEPSWKTGVPSGILLGLTLHAFLKQRTDGVRGALLRPHDFQLRSATIKDAQHSRPIRYETRERQRHFLLTNYRSSGEHTVILQFEMKDGDRTLQWEEHCSREAWQTLFTDDLELMRDPAPQGVEAFKIRFPVEVFVLHRPGTNRGWLVGIPPSLFFRQ
jgi:hypothetical protein